MGRKVQTPFKLGFRCDGNQHIGLGHIVGSLRLARLLSRELGIEIEFLMREDSSTIAMVRDSGFKYESINKELTPEKDIETIIEKTKESSWQGVVVNFCKEYLDSYSNQFEKIKSMQTHLIFMDNPVPPSYMMGDLLINSLPHPDYEGYNPSLHPSCYEGLDYFIPGENLDPYLDKVKPVGKEIRRILVSMGGGDSENLTSLILKGINAAGFKGEVDVILGGANPHFGEISNLLDSLSIKAAISRNIDDMPQRIWEADIGFSSLGLTSIEMALLGLPAIIITGTEFNASVAEVYSRTNRGCINLGYFKTISADSAEKITDSLEKLSPEEYRKELSNACRQIVDGKGSERIIKIFSDFLNLQPLREL